MLSTAPTSSRKGSSNSSSKDLWLATSEGSISDVDVALAWVKKSGGNVNARNAYGLTPLHIATWRNHVPIVRRLLAAGADPNAKDIESGWSSLHRALHFGHLAVASVLLQSSSSITLEDSKFRTPIDLLSGPVLQAIEHKDGANSGSTEVFSWGSGVNYQLGTGNVHIQKLPCKVDTLRDSYIKLVSAAKFHSVALTVQGEVYTWGFGRGGRLGHPELDIHSGQAAVITPMPVTSGFEARKVITIAAAKHHTVAATESGEVFTWGSNREGQLGYKCGDTQPTPRRVNTLKSKIVAVAAANKHTAVISDLGEVFTWGCNKEGQLGYETPKSSSNYTPRCVDSLRGRVLTNVATAKYHTIVLGIEGEVFTWGHRLVTPRRVVIARNIRRAWNTPVQFHRSDRLRITLIAAGVTHSVAVTNDGALFFWVSSGPNLQCQQLFSLSRRKIVSISAGKYWTGVVTDTGDVFTWDGKKKKDELPIATRLHGLKKATSISVGETHLLIVSSLYYPRYSDDRIKSALARFKPEGSIPSLKALCQIPAILHLLEPRSSLPLLEIADSLEAPSLKKHCEKMAIRNLDYILAVATQTFTSTSLDILLSLEKLLYSMSSEKWSYRQFPTPTATTNPAIINSEEDDSEDEFHRTRDSSLQISPFQKDGTLSSPIQCSDEARDDVSKQVRALKKKLQQIEMLEEKLSIGHSLEDQQMKKIQSRRALEKALSELGVSMETMQTKSSSPVSGDGKTSKRGTSRKKKGKSKHKVAEVESSVDFEQSSQQGSTESNLVVETSFFKHMDKDAEKHVYADSSSSFNKDSVATGGIDKDADLCKDPGKQVYDDSSSFAKDFGGINHSAISASKKKNKKGGLSMFLTGGLDATPKPAVPPPPTVVKSKGPAWGGVKLAKGPSSLREIQVEQIKTTDYKPQNKLSNVPEDVSGGNNKIQLGSFLQSCPILEYSDQTRQIPAPILPPSSSSSSRQSLRDIQMQQMEEKAIQDLKRLPASIRAIQMEEQAKQELKRFYGNYKAVK